jgi:TnpA family transposase
MYPTLPSILDGDTLSAVSTLESEELAFATRQGRSRNQYLHALYLKAMGTLGHSHFEPKDLPRQFRQRIAEQLGLADDCLQVLATDRSKKSLIVPAVRAFLGLSPVTREELDKVLRWLQDGPAKRENDVAVLVNAAAEHFRELRVEIPAWNTLQSMAQQALSLAAEIAAAAIDKGLGPDDGERLDTILSGKEGRTLWDSTKHGANDHANIRQQAAASAHESHQNILSELLSIIYRSNSPEALWHAVYQYKTREGYRGIQGGIDYTPSWNTSYLDKLEDYYPALRRFLPDLYRLIPISATTADNAIPRAQAFAGLHATSNQTYLPVEGCPVEFLQPPWENKAVKRYGRTGHIAQVLKVPYEFGLLDATTRGLKNNTVAIAGARRHSPMIDHLLPREEFLRDYDEHVRRLGLPATAAEYYEPRRAQLEEALDLFDKDYQASADNFWVNPNGTLGYSRLPGQSPPPRIKRLRSELSLSMPEVSIFDILLDCQRWTGFMDVFKPVSGRQNMTEEERLRHLLATLYAYGCNCGPVQASRALEILDNQIVYMRRRYMPVQSLVEAASILARAYQQTPVAERLGDMRVLLTDSMQVRTLKDSLIARQHHRYLSGKSTLLYQHVTSSCVCLFTQALLCNVSEGIHMLVGALECRTGRESLTNICDSAGKSNLVFGLSGLLNILLYPRVRSRHLKLWGTGGKAQYKNIAESIAGQIRCDRMDKGWQDIMWILASIEEGTAKPLVILNHLAMQPQHPAAQGLEELGKLDRSSYLLRYGTDMQMRRFVVPETSKREHWNKFTGEVQAFGDLIREKTIEDQDEVFWFLTVIQNAIVLWNALSIENILNKGLKVVSIDDLKHMLPTMTGHINFVGKFDVDLQRKPPFDFLHLIRPS